MKKLALYASYLLVSIAVLYFAFINFNNPADYICPFYNKTYALSLGFIIILVFCIGELCGFLLAMIRNENIMSLNNAYQKRNERISVKSEEDSDAIKALEAKIQTLEAALASALKKSSI